MELTKESARKLMMELRLRRLNGDAFQGFFSDLMQKCHGDDFVRIRPAGRKGDKGCDGYLQSTGQLFQCYGAVNGSFGKVDTLIAKMNNDFQTASDELSHIIKEWYMVHNLVDGLPIHAVEALDELKQNNPDIAIHFFGIESFHDKLSCLDDTSVVELLGPVATSRDALDFDTEALRDLVQAIAEAADKTATDNPDIEPVPVDKLDANNLPNYWRTLISSGWQNTHLVAEYFNDHHDPLLGEQVAKLFRDRYQYLASQDLPPGSIMTSLYEMVAGLGAVPPEKQVVAYALLAHLFESCDIFKNVSKEASG